MNLDLMVDYGCESWKQYNEVLADMHSAAQKQLSSLKKEVQEVNWARKNQQTNVGEKLTGLHAGWVGLVSKNYEIEQALVRLELEMDRLKEENDTTE
jgi:pre-mRNA-splicing factor SPF27